MRAVIYRSFLNWKTNVYDMYQYYENSTFFVTRPSRVSMWWKGGFVSNCGTWWSDHCFSNAWNFWTDTSTCLAVQVHGESDSAILPELPNEGLRHASMASKPNTLLEAQIAFLTCAPCISFPVKSIAPVIEAKLYYVQCPLFIPSSYPIWEALLCW